MLRGTNRGNRYNVACLALDSVANNEARICIAYRSWYGKRADERRTAEYFIDRAAGCTPAEAVSTWDIND